MRNALFVFAYTGLISLFILSACAARDKNGDSGEGGNPGQDNASDLGESESTTMGGYGSDGGTDANANGTALADACPDLLKTLDDGTTNVCSQSQATAEFNHINMLIVMDKSGSMTSTPVGFTRSKWSGAVDALKTALDPQDRLVQYGFLLFPYQQGVETPTCEVSEGELAVNIPVGPASTTVNQITQFMASVVPVGGTPTAAALGAALDYYTKGAGKSLLGAKHVLLVTDGGPNCNDQLSPACSADTCTANMDKVSPCGTGIPNCCAAGLRLADDSNPLSLCLDDVAVVTKIRNLATQGIKTFVVGIPGSEAYASYLDTFAVEGGAPVTDLTKTHRYYEVTGENGLADAFKAITTSLVRSCTVPLEEEPQDSNKINVAIDCTPMPQVTGTVNNWHYDAARQAVVIEGTNCDRIQQTGVNRIDVVIGCQPYALL